LEAKVFLLRVADKDLRIAEGREIDGDGTVQSIRVDKKLELTQTYGRVLSPQTAIRIEFNTY
jgi:hypothetical protein